MQIHAKLVAVAVILVASAESKPTWPNLYISNYEGYKEPSEVLSWYRQAINHPQILQYQDIYTPYPFYNFHPVVDTVHPVIASEKTTISHFPVSVYLGTPLYNTGIPLPSVPNAKKPSQEEKPDKETPDTTTTTTEGPSESMNGTVEKLDTKVENSLEKKKPSLTNENTEKDSVTVEAL